MYSLVPPISKLPDISIAFPVGQRLSGLFRVLIHGRSEYAVHMRRKPRQPCRFAVGERVEILSTIWTRFAGREGVVCKVEASNHAHTLDKYTVRFDDAQDGGIFWDIQLKPGPPTAVVAEGSNKLLGTVDPSPPKQCARPGRFDERWQDVLKQYIRNARAENNSNQPYLSI
jgi:hypothetical protein